MGWIKIRAIRKEAVFTVNVGETFNLESKTGKKNWNDPKFMISIPKYKSASGFVDTRVVIDKTTYPNFIARNNGDFEGTTQIDVYVVEGDLDTITTSGSTWTKTLTIDGTSFRKAMFLLSPSNGYKATLPSWVGQNYKVFYSFKKVDFPKNMIGYTFTATKNGNILSVNLESENATIQTGTLKSNKLTIPKMLFATACYSGTGGFGKTNNATALLYVNNVLNERKGKIISAWNPSIFMQTEQLYVYAEKNKVVDSTVIELRRVRDDNDGSMYDFNKGMVCSYTYATRSSTYKTIVDEYEVNVIVIKI